MNKLAIAVGGVFSAGGLGTGVSGIVALSKTNVSQQKTELKKQEQIKTQQTIKRVEAERQLKEVNEKHASLQKEKLKNSEEHEKFKTYLMEELRTIKKNIDEWESCYEMDLAVNDEWLKGSDESKKTQASWLVNEDAKKHKSVVVDSFKIGNFQKIRYGKNCENTRN